MLHPVECIAEDGTLTAHCSYRISRFFLFVAIVPRQRCHKRTLHYIFSFRDYAKAGAGYVKGVENFKDVSHIPNSFFLSRLPLDFLFIFFAISRAKVLCTDFCSLHGKKRWNWEAKGFFSPFFDNFCLGPEVHNVSREEGVVRFLECIVT